MIIMINMMKNDTHSKTEEIEEGGEERRRRRSLVYEQCFFFFFFLPTKSRQVAVWKISTGDDAFANLIRFS